MNLSVCVFVIFLLCLILAFINDLLSFMLYVFLCFVKKLDLYYKFFLTLLRYNLYTMKCAHLGVYFDVLKNMCTVFYMVYNSLINQKIKYLLHYQKLALCN